VKPASDFRTGRHVIYKLHTHLVFVPKYRRKIISPRAFVVLLAAWKKVCGDFEGELVECGYEADHAHLLVSYPPKVAISTLVNSLKGVSARLLRSAHLPEVDSKTVGQALLEPELLRGVVRGCSARDRKTLRRTATERGFLPVMNGGVSAPEIR